MKPLVVTAVFFTLGVAAVAKPVPVSDLRSLDDLDDHAAALARNDADINIGPAGASLERDYFQAPQMNFNAGGFSCRALSIVFDKTRLAQSCD